MKKVLGLILELNPLHNGHIYFLEQAKKMVNPDIIIGIISTNFTMRGEINIINKFDRTKMLLDLGLDIVIELPFNLSVVSADYFGYNAIYSLNKMGITDFACGVELDDISKLKMISDITSTNSFNTELKINLDKGYSYSTACNNALKLLANDYDIINNYSLPNNTLALQYIKAIEIINNNINISLVKRIENNYYYETFNSDNNKLASATSLRNELSLGHDISKYVPDLLNKYSYIDIEKAENNLFNLLYYKCINHELIYLDNKEGIENRLEKSIYSSNSLKDVISNTITKRYTINYIRRLILNIINETDINTPKKNDYLRVLGFNKLGEKYIKTLASKKEIITTFKNVTNEIAMNELKATKIYGLVTNNYDLYLNEYKIPIKKGEEKDYE